MNDTRTKVDAIRELGEKVTGKELEPQDTIVEMIDEITKNYEGGGSANVPDWSQIGYDEVPNSLIQDFNHSKEIYDNWDASITSMYQKFRDDTALIYMPLVDTSNVTNMGNTFMSCTLLRTIPKLDTSRVTNMATMFYGCGRLIDLPVLDTSNVTTMSGMFQNGGNSLTNDSLNNLLKMCANATSYTGTKTLADLKLLQAKATICETLSNYQEFLDAGWSIGY